MAINYLKIKYIFHPKGKKRIRYMVNVETMRVYVNFMAVNYLSVTCLSTGRMNIYGSCYLGVRNMKYQEDGKHT
jgi:hypothetical protein